MRRLLLVGITLVLLADVGTLIAGRAGGWDLTDPSLDGTMTGVCAYNRPARPPCGKGMRQHKIYPFRFYTHCGAIETWLDGEPWRASPRVQRDNRMGFNSTGGRIELLEPDVARFVGPDHLRIIFRRGPAAPWGCA